MNCHAVFNCVGHKHEITNNALIKETVLKYVNEAEFKELFTIAALEKIETVTSSAIKATTSAVKASLDARNAVNDLTAQTLDFVSDAIYGFKDDIDDVILSMGYITIDSFEFGASITQRNQALRHAEDGKLYRWAGDLPKVVPASSTPASSGGIGVNKWLEVSDQTLRNDIVVGGLVTDEVVTTKGGLTQLSVNKGIESIKELVSITKPYAGMRVFVKSYHTGIDGGGGEFVYDATLSKSKHNGGTIFDPAKAYPTNWANITQKKAWFNTNGSGTGCFVRVRAASLESEFFGTVQYTDATVELNSFFRFVQSYVTTPNTIVYENINAIGSFLVSETIKCNFLNIKAGYFNLSLNAIAPLPIILALSCAQSTLSGQITVESYVVDPITLESLCDIGIAVQACLSSDMPSLKATKCRSWGVLIDSDKMLDSIGNDVKPSYFNNSQANIPRIAAFECGRVDKRSFNAIGGISGYSSTISNLVQIGSSVNQRTEMSVDTLPPEVLGGDLSYNYISINSKPYQLISVDKSGKKISVFPRVPDADMGSTSLQYLMGGGVLFAGSDSNAITVNYIDVYNSVLGVRDASFYGANINQYTTHFSIVSYGIGSGAINIAPMSALCNSYYTEANMFDLVHTGVGSACIGSVNGAFDYSKCASLTVQGADGIGLGFYRVRIGKYDFYSGGALNSVTGNLECKPSDGYIHNYYLDFVQLLILKPDMGLNKLYGLQMMHIVCVGKDSPTGAMTGNITVLPLDIGEWTVNGAKTMYTIPPAVGKPSDITIVWDYAAKNIKVFVH